jgi:hypothetical protein
VYCYRLDDQGSVPGRGEKFSSSLCVQTSIKAHPASYPMGTGGTARPGCDANLSPSFSAEFKTEYELYFLSPLESAWCVLYFSLLKMSARYATSEVKCHRDLIKAEGIVNSE